MERRAVFVAEDDGGVLWSDDYQDTSFLGTDGKYYYLEGDQRASLSVGDLVVLESTGTPVRAWGAPTLVNPGYSKLITQEEYENSMNTS